MRYIGSMSGEEAGGRIRMKVIHNKTEQAVTGNLTGSRRAGPRAAVCGCMRVRERKSERAREGRMELYLLISEY